MRHISVTLPEAQEGEDGYPTFNVFSYSFTAVAPRRGAHECDPTPPLLSPHSLMGARF